MAIDPATAKLIAKAVISQITDEEKRQRLVIGIVVGIVVFIFILAIPILLTSAWESIKDFFGWSSEKEMKASTEYASIYQMKDDYGYNLENGELTFNGELPMPLNNAVVTSEFGNRVHPVTRRSK